MIRKGFISVLSTSLVFGLTGGFLYAQDTTDENDQVFELSPFEVDASDDIGYYASQTLAGGRLNSRLEDVATTVQVVTEEMLDDVGATSLDEVLVYTTNTDVVGSMSIYTGAEAAGDASLSQSEVRQDPGSANRVRGLGRATRTANYFETSIPFDSYISGRVDINRGANSFLFGLGSPGGIINSNLATADFRNTAKVNFVLSTENFESNYSKKGSFSVNRELVDEILAIRVAALEAENEYTQQPAMQDISRRYVALTFKPFKEKRITLRANYEDGDIYSIPVDRLAPLQTLDLFIDDPYGTAFDNPAGRWLHDPYSNIVNNTPGIGYLGVDANGVAIPVNLYNKQRKPNGWATIYDDTINADGFPTRATHSGWTNSRIRKNNSYFDPNNNLTGNTQSGMVRGLAYTDLGVAAGYGGWTRQGLVDYQIYDWRKNLLTGPLDYYSNDFDRKNVSLEAVSKGGNLGIELAFYRERWMRDSFVGIGTPEITMDNNYSFPLGPNDLFGETNPNFGRLYLEGRASNNTQNEDIRTVKRVTSFAKFNFKDHFEDGILSWFGRHTLTGLYDHNKLEQEQFAYRQFIFGNDAGFHLAQPNATQFQRQMLSLYYISDAYPEAFTDSSFTMNDFRVNGLPSNVSVNYPEGYSIPVYYLSEGDPAVDAAWNKPFGNEGPAYGTFTPQWQPTTGTLVKTTVESKAFNLQSFLLNDLLVANLGWREDEVELIRNANPPKTSEQVPILDPEGFNLEGVEGNTLTESVFSYGLVAKVPQKWLPDGTSLSFHYGESENFIPNPGGFDWFGNPVPSSSGTTEELGITVGLMENKLVARLNFYEGNVENEPFVGTDRAYKLGTTAFVVRAYESLWDEMDKRDRDRDGLIDVEYIDDPDNPGTVIEFDPDMDDNGLLDELEGDGNSYMTLAELAQLEQAYSDLVNPWVRETADLVLISGAETESGNPISTSGNGLWFTLGDTVTLKAEGVEFELTYNPTRNLRLSMNITKQKAQRSDVAPRLTLIWNRLLEIADEIPTAKFVSNGANKLSTPLRTEAFASNTIIGQPINNGSVGQAYLAARALSGSDNPEVREYRVNILGNYTFTDGRMKGWNIGGAARYQDEAAAGYPKVSDPISGFPVSDVFNPYFDDSTFFVDAWIGYKRKIFNEKVDWRIQLNIRNVFADKDPVAVQFQPNGSVARVSIPVPRQFVLSNTFTF